MLNYLKSQGRGFIQGVLALIGFGAFTWAFCKGLVPVETYVPLVSLMIGYFFGSSTKI